MSLINYRQIDTKPHQQPQTESEEEVLAARRIVSYYRNTWVMSSNLLVNLIHERPSLKYISAHPNVHTTLWACRVSSPKFFDKPISQKLHKKKRNSSYLKKSKVSLYYNNDAEIKD